MGRQLTEKEVKRFGRVLAGHAADRDRARWKRKVKGQAAGRVAPKKPARDVDDRELDDAGEDDEPR